MYLKERSLQKDLSVGRVKVHLKTYQLTVHRNKLLILTGVLEKLLVGDYLCIFNYSEIKCCSKWTRKSVHGIVVKVIVGFKRKAK